MGYVGLLHCEAQGHVQPRHLHTASWNGYVSVLVSVQNEDVLLPSY